jgi:hypothetical protein
MVKDSYLSISKYLIIHSAFNFITNVSVCYCAFNVDEFAPFSNNLSVMLTL